MRQIVLVSTICLAALACPALAEIKTYPPFQPSPADLWDLDHGKYYTWGIDWSVPADESIVGASLFIDNINNWQVEWNRLYIHLLDNPILGTHGYSDSKSGDQFAGQGLLLATFIDDDPYPNPPEDWTYNFSTSDLNVLKQYIADGRSGFGFDPDCHYYNCGITFTITTETVPEPVTALLAAPALALIRRSRNRRLAV